MMSDVIQLRCQFFMSSVISNENLLYVIDLICALSPFEFHFFCFSLNNVSNRIRWSLDLRFQAADKNPGFYDIKDGIRIRSSKDSNFRPDWDSFNVSRHDTHVEVIGHNNVLVVKAVMRSLVALTVLLAHRLLCPETFLKCIMSFF
jgi:hypothetical protein